MPFDPADEVYEIFGCKAGSPVRDCACGRTNYAGDDELMDEGELERLDAKAVADPTHYCKHQDGDTVVSVIVNGSTRVFGCDCKWEEKLVSMLDAHEVPFIAYYKRKITRMAKQAAESLAALKDLGG